ncbi:MAG: hypothetical protein K6F50_05755 [Kiritimatiellae bacterium]|nr:hypothetical protein [Kiritimatiellia bacterium]
MMKKLISFAVSASLAWSACALVLPSTCESALRRSLGSSASWRMERTLPDAKKTLVTEGEVVCTAGEGIVWKILKPFSRTISMNAGEMVFEDEDEGTTVKKLSELPHYEEIRKETDAFLAGDPKAFEGLFDAEVRFLEDGKWKITLLPGSGAVKKLVAKAELTGDRTLEKVLLESPDGGKSEITFKEKKR